MDDLIGELSINFIRLWCSIVCQDFIANHDTQITKATTTVVGANETSLGVNLPIILSRTSQNFYPFLICSYAITYYSFIILLTDPLDLSHLTANEQSEPAQLLIDFAGLFHLTRAQLAKPLLLNITYPQWRPPFASLSAEYLKF